MNSDIQNRVEMIERGLEAILKRNEMVSWDKKWETSVARRIILVCFTYLAVAFYFLAIGVENPWVNAVVPSVGFLLSTLSLPFIKQIWIRWKKKKENT